jgi:potassium/hydrogen antiporter
MTTTIIIALCILLLIAYLFDLSAAKTKIPSVILLLITGLILRQIVTLFSFNMPNLQPALPILGTVGLILIVLEGALELELNSSKFSLVKKASLMALLPMLLFAFLLAFAINYFTGASFRLALINSIPIAVISSAIAIPSVKQQPLALKAFVVYESSLSDIFGVVFFNFILVNSVYNATAFGHFALELLLMAVISFIATALLSWLLSRIHHHIKFVPIIILVVLIYALSKVYHLPGLIFVLLLGLFLGNLDELKHIRIIQKLNPENLNIEIHKFKEIATEMAFLIRALFFIVFGYLMNLEEIIHVQSLQWSLGIIAAIFLIRYVFLNITGQPVNPTLFVAPRGLITILLFFSIPAADQLQVISKSVITQVIIFSAIIMMLGLMFGKNSSNTNMQA